MPRRSILSAAERQTLLALPDSRDELIRRYTLSESDHFDFESFTTANHRLAVQELIETAMQTEKGIVLAARLVEMLRECRILLPALNAVERVCAEAVTRANRRIYKQLTDG